MAELCDIYDINGDRSGDVFMRGENLKEGEFQLVTSIWILNENLQILIQKRSEAKIISPDIWATHGGCVSSGETSLYACVREAYEEIGIVINPKYIKSLTRITTNKLIMDSYIVIQEFNTSTAVLQVEEVSGLQWVSLNKLEHMVKNQNFFNYQELPYVINFINNLKTNRGL